MASKRSGYTAIYASIAVILVIAIIGAFLVFLGHKSSAELAWFELIVLVLGAAALILAILGGVDNSYQIRVMRKLSKEVHAAVLEIKEIDRANELISKKLNDDYKLARYIAEALAEAGVIEDDAKRHAVAGKIEQKVRKKIKS